MVARLAFAFVAALLTATFAAAASWRLGPETSVAVEVGWQGRSVEVRFPSVSGAIEFDANRPETARARISVAAGDASTGVGVVDALVRGPGFLDAELYPTILFELERLAQTSANTAEIVGRISLRGVTRPIVFQAKVFRYGPDPDAPDRFEAGFDLTGTIDRTEFNSTGGLPGVAATLPVRIRLAMTSR